MANDAAEPLLLDYDAESYDIPSKTTAIVSLRALEDGEDESESAEPNRCSVIARLLMAVRRRNAGVRLGEEEVDRVRFPGEEKKKSVGREWRVRRFGIKTVVLVPLLVVIFFGIVHITNVLMGLVNLIKDDALTYSHDFLPLDQYQKGDYTGLTRGVKPIHCHSHNDYWRRVPLFEALRWGCTGVEADVWYFPSRSADLFVGHSSRDLKPNHTFRSMYVDPLTRIVDQQNKPNPLFSNTNPKSKPESGSAPKNGVFETSPSQTLVLLVDFKSDGHALFPIVSAQLEPLRKKGYLSYYDGKTLVPGPITIVATGNAPFDLITHPNTTTHRTIFFDAPLSALVPKAGKHDAKHSGRSGGQGTVGTTPHSTFDLSNSYYASVDFKKAVGWCWFGRLSSTQIATIRSQIKAAKERGLKSRYWGAPKWPVGVRNMVWRVLVEEGVDYLNGDDLKEMTRGSWGRKAHGSWVE